MPTPYRTLSAPYLFLALATFSFAVVDGVLVNRTIDDNLGDSVTGEQPTYLPDGGWALGSICTTCNIHPGLVDLNKTFDRTWHDTTHHPGGPDQVITVTFSGVAVYVFNIIANTVPFTTTLTNLTFTLDGELVGSYLHAPDASTDILYNVSVYSNTSLTSGPHTLEIQPTGPFSSLILFDYIAYTVDEDITTSASPTQRPSSSPSTTMLAGPTTRGTTSSSPPSQSMTRESPGPSIGVIVGGTVAGVAVVGIVAGVLFFLFRRHRRERRQSSPARSTGSAAGNDTPDDTATMAERRATVPDLAGPPPAYYSGTTPPYTPPIGELPHPHVVLLFSKNNYTGALCEAPLPADSPSRPMSLATTEHSRRYAELTDRIHMIETRMGEPVPAPSLNSTQSTSTSRTTGSRSREARRLARELAALRSEIAELRGLLQHDRNLSSEMMMMYHT